MVAVPTRHPLLANKSISLEELLRYPLVLCDPQACEGHAKYIDRVLRHADMEPLVVERVASSELMMALVSAGFALGLVGASHFRSEEHTSELQSLMRISYAVFCLKKKTKSNTEPTILIIIINTAKINKQTINVYLT